jgi:hypothetical protein
VTEPLLKNRRRTGRGGKQCIGMLQSNGKLDELLDCYDLSGTLDGMLTMVANTNFMALVSLMNWDSLASLFQLLTLTCRLRSTTFHLDCLFLFSLFLFLSSLSSSSLSSSSLSSSSFSFSTRAREKKRKKKGKRKREGNGKSKGNERREGWGNIPFLGSSLLLFLFSLFLFRFLLTKSKREEKEEDGEEKKRGERE